MTKKMKKSRYIGITLRGIAMGAADVVPGVSGGTIAFITGIYEELLGSIKSFDLTALKLLGRFKLKEFWRHINGNFLFALVLGIAISILSLARGMKWLLENQPIQTWSFFFGLIVASALLVGRQITQWNIKTILALAAGIVAGYMITVLTPAQTPETWWFVMLSGAIAVCAMILPGISGAFILLLLGKYQFIMSAVSEINIPVLLLFIVGAAAGIISFSHALSWLLKHYRNVTVAVLTGIMTGSLNKIWPWKTIAETYTDSHGKIQPLVENNVWPGAYELVSGLDAHLWQAALCAIIGFLLITTLDVIARRRGQVSAGTQQAS